MTNTTYFHLKKPAYADPIDVKDFTNNFDVIDTALMASRAEKTQLTNSINKDVVSPCYYIINDNEFDVTVTDRNFSGITYTIEAGHQKRFDLQHATGNMNYLVSDLHEVTFKWYELKGGSGGGSGTTDYSDLSNKPSINNITLSGNKTLADIGILNSDGKIKSDLLPPFVDNMDSYAKRADFPATGVEDRIYLAKDTNLTYIWDGADYAVVGGALALGETSSTAYRGDRGKIAYEHSQATHARTDATAVSIPANKNGYININGTDKLVYEHPKAIGSSDTNPHGTTASDVGLGDALKYSEQTLSKEQKEQARANIGAGTSSFSGSYSDLSNIPSEFTPASHTHSDYISKGEQTLTDAEKAQARANIDAVGETTVSSVDKTTSTVTVPACLGYAGVKMVGGKTIKDGNVLKSAPVEKIVSKDTDGNVKTTISVPNSILSLPDYGCSAGSVYNWVDFENGVYHHNLKKIKLTDVENWDSILWEGQNLFRAMLSDVKSNPNTEMTNMVNSDYETVLGSDLLTTNKSTSSGSGNDTTFYIRDDTYSNLNDFKKSDVFKNGTVIYELADSAKEVKPISAFIPPIPCEEGGTITLQNPHSLDVPNTIVYKEAK